MEQKKQSKEVLSLINAYEFLVKGIDIKAKDNTDDRAYGGGIKTRKGLLFESIAKRFI